MNEVVRTRSWLETDQRVHWEKEIKFETARPRARAGRIVQRAGLKYSGSLGPATNGRPTRASRGCKHAEDKLKLLKKWERELENRSEPLLKLVEQLHGSLVHPLCEQFDQITLPNS